MCIAIPEPCLLFFLLTIFVTFIHKPCSLTFYSLCTYKVYSLNFHAIKTPEGWVKNLAYLFAGNRFSESGAGEQSEQEASLSSIGKYECFMSLKEISEHYIDS